MFCCNGRGGGHFSIFANGHAVRTRVAGFNRTRGRGWDAHRRFAFRLHGAAQVQDRGARADGLAHIPPVAVLAEQVGTVGGAHGVSLEGVVADQALLLQPDYGCQ